MRCKAIQCNVTQYTKNRWNNQLDDQTSARTDARSYDVTRMLMKMMRTMKMMRMRMMTMMMMRKRKRMKMSWWCIWLCHDGTDKGK